MRKTLAALAKGCFVFAVLIGAWLLLYLAIDTPIVPHPLAVGKNLVYGLRSFLQPHIGASLLRVFLSTLAALVIALPLGLLMGYKKGAYALGAPFLYFAFPVPKLALLPIVMLLCGLGEISKLLMLFLIIFFPIVMDITAGVRNMDREGFYVLQAFGIHSRDIRRRVVLPGLLPVIFNSLKISTGIALSVLFFAENYGTQKGLGYFIMNSWQKMAYVDLYTGIAALSLLGFLLFLALDGAEKHCTKWR